METLDKFIVWVLCVMTFVFSTLYTDAKMEEHFKHHECQDVQRYGSLIECKEGE